MIYANIEDLRQAAKRRVPRMFFDYVDSGSWSEYTRDRNTADFNLWQLDQRVLVNVSKRDLSTKIMGQESKLPFMIGPCGIGGTLAARGETQMARAAAAAGIPYALSTFALDPIEDVAREMKGGLWFQLYAFSDRALTEMLLDRARACGVTTLVLTVDATVTARRERDYRSGFVIRPLPTWDSLLDVAFHPRWIYDVLVSGPKLQLGSFCKLPQAGPTLLSQVYFGGRNLDASLDWNYLAWVRSVWKGKLVVKGILNVADARKCAERGADGIVVSNHGGRQLDSAASTITVLPEIAKAVGHQMEILIDSGFRRGQHVIKALCLGAHAVLLGRAPLFGLGAAGEAGVRQVIELIRYEVDSLMGHMGVTSIEQLRAEGPDLIRRDPNLR